MSRVRLEHITQRYGKTTAIQDISFEMPDGAFWVLVGPSGCGKSTLLRTIAGLEPVTEGHLYIGDRCVDALPARQRDVAMVFQNYALYPHMTVAANLAFGLRMRQVSPSEQMQTVRRVAHSLGLESLLERKPRQLSGGQQQRVALGRAIARRPQVFLLDEPLSNLDAQLRDATRAELKELHQEFGITTLYVTHDQTEAMTLGDCIVLLDQGHVQQIGTPQALYSHPASRRVAAFMGSPPMNILSAIVDGSDFWISGQRLSGLLSMIPSPLLAPHSTVHLGIRPEQVYLADADDLALSVRVDVVEPLGRETLIRGRIPAAPSGHESQHISFFVLPQVCPQLGEQVRLAFKPQALFLFDAVSGQRLYPPIARP